MWAGTRVSPGFTLIHGPKDDHELVTVLGIVAASHAYATGTFPVTSSLTPPAEPPRSVLVRHRGQRASPPDAMRR